MLPVLGLGAALAFFKIHNRPFIKIMEASFKYLMGDRLYVWKHSPKKAEKKTEETSSETGNLLPRLTKSKLKDLTWSLDIKEQPTEPARNIKREM